MMLSHTSSMRRGAMVGAVKIVMGSGGVMCVFGVGERVIARMNDELSERKKVNLKHGG